MTMLLFGAVAVNVIGTSPIASAKGYYLRMIILTNSIFHNFSLGILNIVVPTTTSVSSSNMIVTPSTSPTPTDDNSMHNYPLSIKIINFLNSATGRSNSTVYIGIGAGVAVIVIVILIILIIVGCLIWRKPWKGTILTLCKVSLF